MGWCPGWSCCTWAGPRRGGGPGRTGGARQAGLGCCCECSRLPSPWGGRWHCELCSGPGHPGPVERWNREELCPAAGGAPGWLLPGRWSVMWSAWGNAGEQAQCPPAGLGPELVPGKEGLPASTAGRFLGGCLGASGAQHGSRTPGGICHRFYALVKVRGAGVVQVPSPQLQESSLPGKLPPPKGLGLLKPHRPSRHLAPDLPSLWASPQEEPYRFIDPATQVNAEKLDDPENWKKEGKRSAQTLNARGCMIQRQLFHVREACHFIASTLTVCNLLILHKLSWTHTCVNKCTPTTLLSATTRAVFQWMCAPEFIQSPLSPRHVNAFYKVWRHLCIYVHIPVSLGKIPRSGDC